MINCPIYLDRIYTKDGINIRDVIDSNNHLFLNLKNNSKRDTRLQVHPRIRRKGLWLTYVSCKGIVITEYYNGNSTDDEQWGNNDNWVSYFNDDLVSDIVDRKISWYSNEQNLIKEKVDNHTQRLLNIENSLENKVNKDNEITSIEVESIYNQLTNKSINK